MKNVKLLKYLGNIKKFPGEFFQGPEDVYLLQELAKFLASPDPEIIPQVVRALEDAAKVGGDYLGFDHK